MLGSLTSRRPSASQAETAMQCIRVTDPALVSEARLELERADIWCSAASGELWVTRTQADRARQALATRYRLETTEAAIIVHGRA